MPDYSKGKIYKLVSNQTTDVYYGSTCQPLCVRMGGHRSDFKRGQQITAKKLLQFNDCQIILIEKFPCDSKEELLSRERFYIENNKCVNKYIPMGTVTEWKENHPEYTKEYYSANKEKIMNRSKEYYHTNKDGISEKRKEKYDINKVSILEMRKEKITCKCGSIIRKDAKARHELSAKHQIYSNSTYTLTNS